MKLKQFKEDCILWKRLHPLFDLPIHNFVGRQQVYFRLIELYGVEKILKHQHQIRDILNRAEDSINLNKVV